mmetsp:Transcript_27602/g.44462  ORF Transcript_27602/g.44462 Transcript_27602/m.44462 type:complete len:87 (-) Transcript_27602:458-718(-)
MPSPTLLCKPATYTKAKHKESRGGDWDGKLETPELKILCSNYYQNDDFFIPRYLSHDCPNISGSCSFFLSPAHVIVYSCGCYPKAR